MIRVPHGFTRLHFPAGGFMEVNGPFYGRRDEGRFVIGLRVEDRHCNPRGVCHGGMIAAMCDMLLTIGSNVQSRQGRMLPTVSMTCDFLAPAKSGSWIEGRLEVIKVTRNLVFSSGMLEVPGEGVIARASGVMKRPAEEDPRFHPDRYFEGQ